MRLLTKFSTPSFLNAFTLAVIAFGMLAPAYGQSGWLKERGELFTSLNFQQYTSERYYNVSGKKRITNAFSQSSLFFYGEYGLARKLTLILSMPVQTWNAFANTTTVSGLGDLKLEFKLPLYRKKTNISFSVAPEFPTGAHNLFAQNKHLQFEQINLPSGDGEFNLWSTLAVSRSHHSLPFYFSFFSAFNKRTAYAGQSFRNQVQIGLEVGYRPTQQLSTQIKLIAQETLGNEAQVTDFTRGEGSTFTIYTVETAYRVLQQWSLALRLTGFGSWPIQSSNVYRATVLGMGIYYAIKPKKEKN